MRVRELGQSIHIKKFQLFFQRTSVPPAMRSAEVPFTAVTKIYEALAKVEIRLKQPQHMFSNTCQNPAAKKLCSLFLCRPCPADHTDKLQ